MARFQTAFGGVFQTGRVEHGEVQVRDPSLTLAAVPRHARRIVDQRQPLADETV